MATADSAMQDSELLDRPDSTVTSHVAPAARTASPHAPISVAGVVGMQRLAGNRAAAAMVQTKLEVGGENDLHEHEADQAADHVMRQLARRPDTTDTPRDAGTTTAAPLVQRRAEKTTTGAEGGVADASTQSAIAAARGGGIPLPTTIRRSMEGAFGTGFDNVRVHTDGRADAANASLQARAFTTGSDIFFRRGAYEPATSEGAHLIAHELAHVVQQRGASRSPIRRKPDRANPVSPPTNADRGYHDYRMYAKLGDPAPAGWSIHTDQATGDSYYVSDNGAPSTWSLPLQLERGIQLGGRFKNAVKELQRKLVDALGGRARSGIWKRDGKFGSSTEKAVKKFQETNGLPVTGRADDATWKVLDAQGGARQGQVDFDWGEKLTEFDMQLGARARFDWKKKDDELKVNVPIKFVGDTTKVPTIAEYIRQTWNVFDITYKGSKTPGKGARRPKHPKIKLNFDPEAKAPQADEPIIQTSAEVFVWTGDHPKADERTHLTPDDARSRSDAGNWKADLPDDDLKNMVGHEFGHLIGLEDEYSRGHEDLARLTGKDVNAHEDPTRWKRILNHVIDVKAAIDGAKTKADIFALNDLLAAWMGPGNSTADEVLVILEEYRTATGSTVGADFEAAAKRVAAELKAGAMSDIERLKSERAARSTKNLLRYASVEIRKSAMNTGRARPLTDGQTAKFNKRAEREARKHYRPDLNTAYGVAYDKDLESDLVVEATKYRAWLDGFAKEGYSTGGLMGDYSKIGQQGPDTRATSPALEHQHALEPRHVQRFAEYVMKYKKDEIWEITRR